MRVSRSPPEIILDQVQREQLEVLTGASSASQAEVLRARIILLAALNQTNEEIADELQTTATWHPSVTSGKQRRVYELNPESFARDLEACRSALAAAGVGNVRGYRAPEWSINDRSLWALDSLARAGFTFDHIFLILPSGPIRTVTRCVPIYLRPIKDFCPQTPYR